MRDKESMKKYQQEYRQKNKERLANQARLYRQDNKEKLELQKREYLRRPEVAKMYKETRKKWYEKNKERLLNKAKEYRNSHKGYTLNYAKEYHKKHREEMNDATRIYQKENKEELNRKKYAYVKKRRETDKNYNLKCRLRTRIWESISTYSKTGKIMQSVKYGIDYERIIEHLKPFPEELSKYEVDHIMPLCSFDLTNPEEVKKAFAPNNHQWLLAEENLRKGGKYENAQVYG